MAKHSRESLAGQSMPGPGADRTSPGMDERIQRARQANRRAARSVLVKAGVLLAAAYVMFGVVFGIAPMKGNDMRPIFGAGDLLLYYRLETSCVRGDVVMIERDGSQYVGRIVGMPGDEVEVSDSILYLNGSEVVEPEIFYETPAFQGAVEYPLVLGDNEYFVLGDSRESAKDSRYFGAVRSDEIRGKVISVLRRVDV